MAGAGRHGVLRRRGSAPAPGPRRVAGAGPHDGDAGRARRARRHRPRLRRADQAADHRAAARHDRPGHGPRHARGARASHDWPTGASLVFWTMVGGTLAAGSANAINCYLDRDIDLLMTRTRRRPLPAHQVEPERAVVFGLVLGVDLVRADGLVREPDRGVPDAARDRASTSSSTRSCSSARRRRTSSSAGRPARCRRSSAGPRSPGSVGHPGAAAVRDRLLLDAAALLGAVAADPQGLRRGRRADAAGGQGHPRDDPPDRPVHDPAWSRSRSCFWAVARMGAIYLGRGGRPRRDLPVAGVRAVAARRVGGGLDRRRDPRSTSTRSATCRLLFLAVAVDALVLIPV